MNGIKLQKMMLNKQLQNKLTQTINEVYTHTVSNLPYYFCVLINCFILKIGSGTLSRKSGASQASYKQRVAAQKKREASQAEWDRSTVASEKREMLTAEDKVA